MLPPLLPKPLRTRARCVALPSNYERPLPPRLAHGAIKHPLRVIGTQRLSRAPKPAPIIIKTQPAP